MSSQSRAVAPVTVAVVSRRPSPSSANTLGVSPLSLWVHHTPGLRSPPASPDVSIRPGAATEGWAMIGHWGQAPGGGTGAGATVVVLARSIRGGGLVGLEGTGVGPGPTHPARPRAATRAAAASAAAGGWGRTEAHP